VLENCQKLVQKKCGGIMDSLCKASKSLVCKGCTDQLGSSMAWTS